MVFETLVKGFLVAGQLPLDTKLVFPNVSLLRDLGDFNNKAFTYYEYMKVLCQENGIYYVWQEVASDSNIGLIENNFQYPLGTISNTIDYSERYFNFVPENVIENSFSVAKPYVIYKEPSNLENFLEINDIVVGHFSPTLFMTAKYIGGLITDINNWAIITSTNPKQFT